MSADKQTIRSFTRELRKLGFEFGYRDRRQRKLYILPVPCCGVVITFPESASAHKTEK